MALNEKQVREFADLPEHYGNDYIKQCIGIAERRLASYTNVSNSDDILLLLASHTCLVLKDREPASVSFEGISASYSRSQKDQHEYQQTRFGQMFWQELRRSQAALSRVGP